MVKIEPFKGITYNPKILDLDISILAPPYDVISPKFQDELYSRSEYNVVRLILGKIQDTDTLDDNRYTRAADFYTKWLKDKVLVQSDKPAIYYYIQQYEDLKGKYIERKGFITRCYLEDFSNQNILPHEETMGGPKEDRLNLMLATKANFSQIFSVYSDTELIINKTIEKACNDNPMFDVIDDDGVRHIFYDITDENTINFVKSQMENKVALIADGHHRYETALKYRDMKREENNDADVRPHDYLMMYFSNIDDEGLVVYPTHRLLKKVVNLSLKNFIELLNDYFEIEEINLQNTSEALSIMDKYDPKANFIGLLSKEASKKLYVLKPINEKIKEKLVKNGIPEILTKLDVTILHRLILEALLNLDMLELKSQNNIEFVRNEDDLVEKYDSGQAELVFLVNKPDVSTVKEICMAGFRMPQKTTYFYPKLLSGLVINSLV